MRGIELEKELEVARAAATQAGEVALRHWDRGVEADVKPDGSPVTAADRECERLIAGLLEEAFPADGLLGEEGTRKQSRSRRQWIIDPIDGTRDFFRGNPCWAILIGLEADGAVAAGIAYLPALGEMYTAARGRGACCNDSRIRVSANARIENSVLCMDGLDGARKQPFVGRLLEWMGKFWAVRSMGGCLDAMLVASGRAEAWIEPKAEAWDLAPIQVILEEAGGCFFNFDGGSSIYGGNCVVCVPSLELELRRFIVGGGEL